MRQIILDTETTGLSPQQGHRIIEIGCVELLNRRFSGKTFHVYLQPDRAIDPGAMKVHGITNEFLEGKPRFKEIAQDFKDFIKGSELIIHNAPFDVGFIENEFKLIKDKTWQTLTDHCQILDTLVLARQKHPGQRNNLDALCKRYGVDNQHRDKHGALLDAEILGYVYLGMTGGQNTLTFEEAVSFSQTQQAISHKASNNLTTHIALPIIYATPEELVAHKVFVKSLEAKGIVHLWNDN